MRVWARALLTAVVVAAIAGASVPAGAAPTDADKARARALLNEGYDLMEQGLPKAAIDKFREADGLVHYPVTGLSLGRALAASELLIEASAVLHQVAADPPKPGEPPPFTQARKDADDLVKKVDGEIPTLVVRLVSPPSDVHVTLDVQPLAPTLLGTKMKVDPGAHVVIADGGGTEKRSDIALREGEFNEAALDFSAPAAPAGATSGASGDHGPAPVTSSGSRWLVYAGFGLGAVGLGVGAVTGGLAFSDRNSALNDGCSGGKCPPAAQSDEHAMQTMATVSTIAFAVGAAGVVTGVVALLLPSKRSETGLLPDRQRSHAHLVLGPGYLGVGGEL
jgi:hypothetical protein